MDVVQDSFQPKSKRIIFHTIICSAFKSHIIISHYVDSKDTKLNDVGIISIRYTYIMCSMIFSGFGVILGRYPTFINSYHHCNFLHMYSAQPPGPYPGVYIWLHGLKFTLPKSSGVFVPPHRNGFHIKRSMVYPKRMMGTRSCPWSISELGVVPTLAWPCSAWWWVFREAGVGGLAPGSPF